MGDFLSNFLRGAGSILEIMPPAPPQGPPVRLRSEEEALAGDWERVGAHLRRAMGEMGVPAERPTADAKPR